MNGVPNGMKESWRGLASNAASEVTSQAELGRAGNDVPISAHVFARYYKITYQQYAKEGSIELHCSRRPVL
jgi:class 3 adenylate cyclase